MFDGGIFVGIVVGVYASELSDMFSFPLNWEMCLGVVTEWSCQPDLDGVRQEIFLYAQLPLFRAFGFFGAKSFCFGLRSELCCADVVSASARFGKATMFV